MQEVTLIAFQELLKESSKIKKAITVVERDIDSEWYIVTTYSFKPLKQVHKEILASELEEFLEKVRNPVYYLVDEVPSYLQEFADDSKMMKEFQKLAKIIADKSIAARRAVTDYHDDILTALDEMVHMYRISERSGESLAEMYLEDIEFNLPERSQDEIE